MVAATLVAMVLCLASDPAECLNFRAMVPGHIERAHCDAVADALAADFPNSAYVRSKAHASCSPILPQGDDAAPI